MPKELDLNQIVTTCECSGSFILSSQQELIEEVEPIQYELTEEELIETTEDQPVE